MADQANTNAFLANQMALTIQQYLNYANTDIAVYTTPSDGGPYGNGWVYFTTVTNGTVFQPSYPTLTNALTGPAQVSSNAANAAMLANTNAWQANTNANTANTNAWFADANAVVSNTNAQIANTNAWIANTEANVANTGAWAANTAVYELIANSGSGIFAANASAWAAEANAVIANTMAWEAESDAVVANTNAWIANTNANIANTGAWEANAAVWDLISNSGSGILFANASAWMAAGNAAVANSNSQLANTNAWIANTNSNLANFSAWQANTNAYASNVGATQANAGANVANTNAWLAEANAVLANSSVQAIIANSTGIFTANTNAWIAANNANTANTFAWIAANAAANAVTHNAVIKAIGYTPFNSNGGTINGGISADDITVSGGNIQCAVLTGNPLVESGEPSTATWLHVSPFILDTETLTSSLMTIGLNWNPTGQTVGWFLNTTSNPAGGHIQPFNIAAQLTLNGVPVASRNTTTFTSSSLTSGSFTFTHNINFQFPSVHLVNSSNVRVSPDSVTYTNANACVVNLSSQGSITGTWTAVAIG